MGTTVDAAASCVRLVPVDVGPLIQPRKYIELSLRGHVKRSDRRWDGVTGAV